MPLSVPKWEDFQHYKDRRPSWIKFYNSVLDDYKFGLLSDASKWHLVAIWLLASRTDNAIPDDSKWIARMIGADNPVDIERLVSLGFIERYDDASTALASCSAFAMPEKRREEETREEKSRAESLGIVKASVNDSHAVSFVDIWVRYPKRAGSNSKAAALKAYRARLAGGVNHDDMLAGVERYAAFVRATGKEGTEYVKQAATFLGPNEHWAEPWDLPANTASQKINQNVASITEGLLRYGNGE